MKVDIEFGSLDNGEYDELSDIDFETISKIFAYSIVWWVERENQLKVLSPFQCKESHFFEYFKQRSKIGSCWAVTIQDLD